MSDLICSCGFRFAGPGEYNNAEVDIILGAFPTTVCCPECGKWYIDGKEPEWGGPREKDYVTIPKELFERLCKAAQMADYYISKFEEACYGYKSIDTISDRDFTASLLEDLDTMGVFKEDGDEQGNVFGVRE